MVDYFQVPRTGIPGPSAVPRLILGDNGFLKRYGSRLAIPEIADRIRDALDRADVGVGAGDARVLRAARRAQAPWVLHHTDVAFLADGRRAHFGRCMATLHADLTARAPRFAANDPLMGHFVAGFAGFRPYDADTRFTTDDALTERIVDRIQTYRPAMTTIGGDYLDALIALGAIDAARRSIEPVLDACRRSGSIPALTTYLAGLVDRDEMESIAEGCAAVMAPMNELGIAMPPTKQTARENLQQLGLPIIAMHVLAAGRLKPDRAIRSVLRTQGVAAAIIGASTPEHITQLINAARTAVEEGVPVDAR